MAIYGEVLAQNIRAARSRRGLGQESVAARMRALGHDAWIRQTVSSTEKARRRVTAEEVFALAWALETSIPGLTAATPDDRTVDLPTGSIEAKSVERLALGFNDGAVKWNGDVPVFGPGQTAWMIGDQPRGGPSVDEILHGKDLDKILHQGDEG